VLLMMPLKLGAWGSVPLQGPQSWKGFEEALPGLSSSERKSSITSTTQSHEIWKVTDHIDGCK
jgi:hypothetical protein